MKYVLTLILILIANIASAEYRVLQRVRELPFKGILGDIDGHLQRGHIYADSDKVTWAHETTHGINARIRNELRVENGYYLLEDRVFVIQSPNFTLSAVANSIPVANRGRIFKLYMLDGQQWWNDSPFYIMDECGAYVNGCIVGLEYNMKDRTLYSYDNAVELWGYMRVAQEMARKSNFSGQKDLDIFMEKFYNGRIQYLKTQFKKRGWSE